MPEEEALVLVMPWLSPGDLASLACTCSALARAGASVNRSRVADLARGLEPWPVPIINTVDHSQYPFFTYLPSCCLPSQLLSQIWGRFSTSVSLPDRPDHRKALASTWNSGSSSVDVGGFNGTECSHEESILDLTNAAPPCEVARLPSSKKQRSCRCEGSETSLCGRTLNGELAYDGCSRLRFAREGGYLNDFGDVGRSSREYTISILECGATCSCNLNCKYRVTQNGLAVKVALVRDTLKGWGLRAEQIISRGSFVCEYAGELLTTGEAQKRQCSYDRLRKNGQKFVSALLVVREHLPSGQSCLRLNIDATRIGNVARFLNHACDGGNLQPCLVRSTGSIIPKLALFARKNIGFGEELTFSYGDTHKGLKTQICFCGTVTCKGVMPSEAT